MKRAGAIPLSVVFAAAAAACVAVVLYTLFDGNLGKRRTSACAYNLKHIGEGILQYAQDYDETLPRAWYGKDAGPSSAVNYKWMDAIGPYLRLNSLVLRCPADDDDRDTYVPQKGSNYGSYVYNNAYYAPGDKFTPPGGLKLSMIPDNMAALVMDGQNDFQFSWPDAAHQPSRTDGNPPRLGAIALRHDGPEGPTALTLYVCGLVQCYSLRQTAAERTIRGQKVYTGFTVERDFE